MDFLYDESGSPYSFIYNGTQYYYVKNLQGDVMRIVDATGAVVANYFYDAWGKVTTSSSIGQTNPIRYRGYYYDTDTGFYYLQSRYYDPTIKRFISADDTDNLGANGDFTSLNLYAYCGNNPVARSDFEGEFWNIVIGAAAGGLIAGLTALASQVIENKGFNNINVSRIVVAATAGAISGGLAATGILVEGQMIANGVIGAISSGIDTYLSADENTTALDYVSNIAIGAGIGILGGRIGKNGTGNKHLSASAGRMFRRVWTATKNVSKHNFNSTLKEIGNAGKYYYSQIWKQSLQNGGAACLPIFLANIPNLIYSTKGVYKYFE